MSGAASPRRGQPRRGLSSRLSGCHRRAGEQLPGPAGISATGSCCLCFCLSALGGSEGPSVHPRLPGGSLLPSHSPSGSLRLLAGVWASGLGRPGSSATASLWPTQNQGQGRPLPVRTEAQ